MRRDHCLISSSCSWSCCIQVILNISIDDSNWPPKIVIRGSLRKGLQSGHFSSLTCTAYSHRTCRDVDPPHLGARTSSDVEGLAPARLPSRKQLIVPKRS